MTSVLQKRIRSPCFRPAGEIIMLSAPGLHDGRAGADYFTASFINGRSGAAAESKRRKAGCGIKQHAEFRRAAFYSQQHQPV